MKRVLPILIAALWAPFSFAANDVVPSYPELELQKNVTTVSTGSPKATQPVAYQITATGTGATVSATVKIYCKTINLAWASGTQQGSDITLSASNSDVDTSVTVTGGCPYMYSDVTAISSTTVNVVATPIYQTAGTITSLVPGTAATNLGKAEDAGHNSGDTGVAVWGVRNDTTTTSLCGTNGDYCPLGMTQYGGATVTIVTPAGDSAMDDTANAVQTINAPIANTSSLGSAVTGTGAQTAVQGRSPATAMVTGSVSASTGSATVLIQVSNDSTNFITACTITLSLTTSVSADGCGIQVPWRYIRMNISAISGTGAAVTGTLGG